MQLDALQQALGAIPDLTARYQHWLALLRRAVAQAHNAPPSDENAANAEFLWRYPFTVASLDSEAQVQWQTNAQNHIDLREQRRDTLDQATNLQRRKKACRDRIWRAWGIEVKDILADFLDANHKDLGRTTLEDLATLSERHTLFQVESILKEVITERVGKEAHAGKSRKQKLTRLDVTETMARLSRVDEEQEQDQTAMSNVRVRRKRKRGPPTGTTKAMKNRRAESTTTHTATTPMRSGSSDESGGSADEDDNIGTHTTAPGNVGGASLDEGDSAGTRTEALEKVRDPQRAHDHGDHG